MNTSMLLMTAWIAGADVAPAGCAGCTAPAPAPAVVAAPAAECDTCGTATASPKLGLFTKLKGLFASMGHHKKADAGCDTCGEAAPACDGCSAPAAVPTPVPAPAAPAVMPAAPVETPKEMPKPAPAPVVVPKEKVVAPKTGGFDIPVVVTPVSETQKVPVLANSANPF